MRTKDNNPHGAKRILFVAAVILFLVVSGCGSMLDRPAPSEADYIAHYTGYFDVSQIQKVDYAWRGAIGGIGTVARFQFKGPVKTKDTVVDARIKAGEATVGTYDPAGMTEQDVWQFKHKWTFATDGENVPSWLDFPFDRTMRTIRETGEPSDGHPPFDRVWYIDDQKNVVYFWCSSG